MSKHKQIKEFVLSQALDYKKQLPDDVWVDEYILKGSVTVSGVWLQDVIDILTKRWKKNV
jgi:hypothetical protein